MNSKNMNSKKIMIYSAAALGIIVLLKILVAISWKLIIISVVGLGLWLMVDKIIKPRYHKWLAIEHVKFD